MVNKNELHVLARQAMRETNTNGDDTLTPWMVHFIERFGVLVALAEREACVRECDKIERQKWRKWDLMRFGGAAMTAIGARDCAAAIRARGEA